MLDKTLNSFKNSLKGLGFVWKEERNFRIQVICAVIVIALMKYFNFIMIEELFCVLAITLVLSAEIINTIVEDLCNHIEPNQNPTIGKIKDMASAFVLLLSFGAFLIGFFVFYHHFYPIS